MTHHGDIVICVEFESPTVILPTATPRRKFVRAFVKFAGLFLLTTLFLVGCDSSVAPEQLKQAEALCEKNEGLSMLVVDPLTRKGTTKTVICKNGATFFWQKVSLKGN